MGRLNTCETECCPRGHTSNNFLTRSLGWARSGPWCPSPPCQSPSSRTRCYSHCPGTPWQYWLAPWLWAVIWKFTSMFRGVPGFTLSSLSIRVPAWKKNICCEICFLAFRGCHRKYTTIIQRQNPTQVAYLAHAHIEDRNRGAPLDFAGDFNVVTENASLNLWIVRSGLYLLYIYHLPICADICLYVFFDYLPIANICWYLLLCLFDYSGL